MGQSNEELEKGLESIFGGIIRFTTIDDFGNLSATFFTQGCNLRCRYCYNFKFLKFLNGSKITFRDLKIISDGESLIKKEELIKFLKSRRNLLDSIVFCGGEPTVYGDKLLKWVKFVKSLGYKVKLDTNGTYPENLKLILPYIDFVSIDFKANKKMFEFVTGGSIELYNNVIDSIKLIIDSGIDYNVRTTVHSDLFQYDDLEEIAEVLEGLNVQNWIVQKCLNVEMLSELGADVLDYELIDRLKPRFKNFKITNLD